MRGLDFKASNVELQLQRPIKKKLALDVRCLAHVPLLFGLVSELGLDRPLHVSRAFRCIVHVGPMHAVEP